MKTHKKCNICKKLLLINEFNKDRHSKDGHTFRCKKCNSKYLKIYNSTHKKQHNENKKIWRVKNYFKVWAWGAINSHKRRGYIFNFESNYIIELAIKTKYCSICGCELQYERFKGLKKITATIDRKTNEKILDKYDIWIICHECNAMKRSKTLVEYVEYCRMIVNKYDGGKL